MDRCGNYTCVYYIVDQGVDEKRFICIEASLAGIGRRLRRCTLPISLYIQRQRPSPTLLSLPYHYSHGKYIMLYSRSLSITASKPIRS